MYSLRIRQQTKLNMYDLTIQKCVKSEEEEEEEEGEERGGRKRRIRIII